MRVRLRGAGLLAVLLVAAACGDSGSGVAEDDSTVPVIVATTSIWADVVANVACDDIAEVRSLVPAGSDPHAFEPSLADRGEMQSAALVVENGLGLEAGLADTLDAVADDGTAVLSVAELFDASSLLAVGSPDGHDDDEHGDDEHDDDEHEDDEHEDDDHGDDDHGHAHGGGDGADPHIWFDPVLVAEVVPALAEAIGDMTVLDAEALRSCGEQYRARLLELDDELASTLESVPAERRKLVTNHDSLGYFASRYDFTVIGTVIPANSALAEPNAADLQALGERIEEAAIPAIFAEVQASTDDAEALARRLDGVEVVELVTGTVLVGDDGTPGSYVELLRTNAALITDALG